MDLLRGKITKSSDREGKSRLFSAEGRLDESLEDRELIQSSGFASVPKEGDEVLVLSFGNLRIAIATDSKDRPSLEVGEAAVYGSNRDGSGQALHSFTPDAGRPFVGSNSGDLIKCH
jgi:phage gp45-like